MYWGVSNVVVNASRSTRFGAGAAPRRCVVLVCAGMCVVCMCVGGCGGGGWWVCRDSCLLSVRRNGSRLPRLAPSRVSASCLVVRVATETQSSEPRLLGRLV